MNLEANNYIKSWKASQRKRVGDDCNAYVYVHLKNNGEPFYVGIGQTDTRPWDYRGRSDWHKRVANKHGVRTEIIIDCIELSVAKNWETIWIKQLSDDGYLLVNGTPGGDSNPMDVQEIREKQKANVKRGENHSSKTYAVKQKLKLANLGKKYSEDINIKKGRKGPKELTEEGRLVLKRPRTEETKSKMSLAALNRSEDHNMKLSSAATDMWARRSEEQKSSIAKRGWETRKRNQQLKEI